MFEQLFDKAVRSTGDVGATWGSATIRELTLNVGESIRADFAWLDAQEFTGYYAVMGIIDPTGETRVGYTEYDNANGSHTLYCIADMVGTWKAKIFVYTGYIWLVYIDTVEVIQPSEITLAEAVTCRWVDGYNNHGEEVTEFDIDEVVYAYIEIHGDDLYGKTVRHEWWYKATGESSFTKRWEWTKTCGSHYTEWATWTWWDIGMSYGSGTGYIKIFVDDVHLGRTSNYTMSGVDYGIADIVVVEYPSVFVPDVAFDVVVSLTNIGDFDDNLFIKITNVDTGELLDEVYYFVPAGTSILVPHVFTLTLSQTTEFNGLIEGGHGE
jgi:hypothetical protein